MGSTNALKSLQSINPEFIHTSFICRVTSSKQPPVWIFSSFLNDPLSPCFSVFILWDTINSGRHGAPPGHPWLIAIAMWYSALTPVNAYHHSSAATPTYVNHNSVGTYLQLASISTVILYILIRGSLHRFDDCGYENNPVTYIGTAMRL